MWSTNNHKIAAAFAGLGFRVVINETQIVELNSWKNLRFEVSDTSLHHPNLPHRDDLYRGWMEGTLAVLDNDHPFLCGIHACHNMECLMKLQATQESFALQLVKGSPLYRYETGVEDPRLALAEIKHATVDLPLAAAVGLVGLPVINIDGAPPRRRYLFPDLTHSAFGIPHSSFPPLPVASLFQRIEAGRPNLALGLTHPQHPVIHGYNATYAYADLLSKIKPLKRRILIKDPFSDRRVLAPENPSPAFEDEIRQHFRIPG
jgi:hypothetical protein